VVASPRPPSWAIEHTGFNAGVLGETAPALAAPPPAPTLVGAGRGRDANAPWVWGDEL